MSTTKKESANVKDTKLTIKAHSLRNNTHLRDIIYISLFTALIAVCSQIFIPTPTVPFTMQTFAVFLAGSMLGWKRGTLSIIVYMLLGIIGIPVFSKFSSGLSTLLGITGGYIIGFVFTTFIIGLMCDKLGKKVWVLISSMIIGLTVCYAFGTVWFMIIYSHNTGTISLWGALTICVFPYLIFDAAKIAVASLMVNRLNKIVRL